MPRAKRKVKARAKKKPLPIAKLTGVERVLALDPSSRCCGWSLFDSGELASFGRFVQKGEGHGERLMNFRTWLLEIFETTKPDILVYEAPYSGRMRNTFGVLSKYAGQIEAVCFEWTGQEIPKENAFPARMVKKLLGVKKGADHEANKKNVLLLVNRLYGLGLKFKSNDLRKAVSQDDEADAIALNHAWHERYRQGKQDDTAEEDTDE